MHDRMMSWGAILTINTLVNRFIKGVKEKGEEYPTSNSRVDRFRGRSREYPSLFQKGR